MCESLQPHGLQHTRLHCPSPTPRACSNSCPLSWWCHPTISSSVIPFSSHLQSFPASGSFQMSQLFISGGQSIGVLASTSVLPMNTIHCWTILFTAKLQGFSVGSTGKKICLQCRKSGFNPWVGKIPCIREWQHTPVFFPGKFHGQRSLVGYIQFMGSRRVRHNWATNIFTKPQSLFKIHYFSLSFFIVVSGSHIAFSPHVFSVYFNLLAFLVSHNLDDFENRWSVIL